MDGEHCGEREDAAARPAIGHGRAPGPPTAPAPRFARRARPRARPSTARSPGCPRARGRARPTRGGRSAAPARRARRCAPPPRRSTRCAGAPALRATIAAKMAVPAPASTTGRRPIRAPERTASAPASTTANPAASPKPSAARRTTRICLRRAPARTRAISPYATVIGPFDRPAPARGGSGRITRAGPRCPGGDSRRTHAHRARAGAARTGVLGSAPVRLNFRSGAAVQPMEADDLALVTKAQAGDPAAFRALVVRYQRKVYALALGIVKDADLAWDVAQEAFVRVHGHLGAFEGKSSFSTWVFRIATHLSIDTVRRERHLAEGRRGRGARDGPVVGRRGDPRDPARQRSAPRTCSGARWRRRSRTRSRRCPRSTARSWSCARWRGSPTRSSPSGSRSTRGRSMSRLFHARKKMQVALRDYAERAAADDEESAP